MPEPPKSTPKSGRCPHCKRIKEVRTRGMPHPVMIEHPYRPPGGKQMWCPGGGRRCDKNTERY